MKQEALIILIDPTTILTPQSNPLTRTKVVEEKMEMEENDNIVKGINNGT